MTDMLEKRAIALAWTTTPEHLKHMGPERAWRVGAEDYRMGIRTQALSVLRVLREPDNEMQVAGGLTMEEATFNGLNAKPDSTIFDDFGLSFTAAIDAILPKEEKGE